MTHPSSSEIEAALAPLVEVLARLLAPRIAPLVREQLVDVDADPMVAVDQALGCSRRAAADLCRDGAITGAVLLQRRWKARRSAIAAHVRACAEAERASASAAANDDAVDPIDRELALAGLVRATPARVAGPPRRR